MSPQKKSCLIGSPRGLSTSCSGVARCETKTETESKITFVLLSTKTRPLKMFLKNHCNPSRRNALWLILAMEIITCQILYVNLLHLPEATRRWSIALCLCALAAPRLVPSSHRTGKYRRWRPRSDWAVHAETWTSHQYTWRRRRPNSTRMRKIVSNHEMQVGHNLAWSFLKFLSEVRSTQPGNYVRHVQLIRRYLPKFQN